jgi:hypothetical protein
MWYRIVKSGFIKIEDLKIPAYLPEGEENIKSPLFSNIESQLNEIRSDEDPIGTPDIEKGQGGMYMKNGEGVSAYASGKGAPMFQDNFPSDKQLI